MKNYGTVGSYAAMIYGNDVTNITFENVILIQDDTLQITTILRGIVINNGNNIMINNCTFKYWNEQSLRLDSCENVNIINNTFGSNNRGSVDTVSASDGYGAVALFSSTKAFVSGNKFLNSGTGISIYNSDNIDVYGNIIEGNIENISAMGIYVLENSENININDNLVSVYSSIHNCVCH